MARTLPPGGDVGIIVRNSTPLQIGNYRSELQLYDLPERVRNLGYTPRIYEEQGTSGSKLDRRPATLRALDDLDRGELVGLAVLDIKRATRDETGLSSHRIKQAVKRAHGVLITRDTVFDFRIKSSSRLFDIQALTAGWEWRDIRDATWDGITKRASKAGDELMLRAVPPPGYRLEVTGYHRNGVPIRVPRQREDEAELAAYVWQLFDEMPSLHSVCRRLNQEDRLRPMRRKVGCRTWDANDLTRMLRNTIYFGAVTWGVRREQARRTGELSDVLDEFEPTTHISDQLAYVSRTTWERLNKRFPPQGMRKLSAARPVASRHPLAGVLLCPRCGNLLTGAGESGFNCRLSIHGLCEGFRVLDRFAEQQACEILDRVFASIDVTDLYERVVAERSEVALSDRRKALEAELANLDSQEERLIDAVAVGAIAQEPARRKTDAISKRRPEIRDELRQMSHAQETHNRALEYVEHARQIGIGRLVASMDVNRRRRFFHGAFKNLTLDGRGRGVWRKRWIKGYELSDPLDTFISRRASGYMAQSRMQDGVIFSRTVSLK